jgi:Tol biopolymer transport system component
MFINKVSLFLLISFMPVLVPAVSNAQFDSHPDLDWYSIETEHFFVHYHSGTERTANTTAKIAEEIFGPITELYNYKPNDKVHFIITDIADVANGATDYYNNRIEIFASAMDFDLRGTHNWLRNVITHEFTHAIQIQASLKYSQKIPALYLQWLNYEKERRPDVLYGYPNVIVSYPISGVGVPAWFAEGTAQYQRQQIGYDYWDAHRDMILRSYSLDNNLLSYNEMGQFSSLTSLKAESIYNLGFGLTRYIAEKYGESKLREISNNLGDFTNFSMDRAMKKALGKDGKEIYNEWKAFLKSDYEMRTAGVKNNKIEGLLIERTGFANYYPQFSPDGKKIAYLSNQEFDYGSTGLYIYDLATKKSKNIISSISTNYSWSPDSKKILYAKRNRVNLHHETYFDIYEYDIAKKDEKRLTTNLRAFSPSYSPDGNRIVFIVNKDGVTNLRISDSNGKNIKNLTSFRDGEQVYNPKFTPDGKNIVFDFSLEESRKIAMIDIESGNMEFIINEPGFDSRNPVVSKDGKKLFFSSNETGIFNIYTFDLETSDKKQITNVLGGAFMPSIDENGNIVYASYHSTGYKIALLNNFIENDPSQVAAYIAPDRLIKRYASTDSLTAEGSKFKWSDLQKFDDKGIQKFESKPYSSKFTPIAFIPLIRYDNYTRDNNFLDAIKPGLYFYSTEVLNRFSIFGGAAINRKLERDIYLQFQYNNGFPIFKDFFSKTLSFSPVLTLEGFNVTRKSQGDLIASVDTITIDITYDLLAFDFSMGFNVINLNHYLKTGYSYSKYKYVLDPFVIPQSGIPIRASTEDYFKSHALSLEYDFESFKPYRHRDINPAGRDFKVRYEYEMSKINPELVVNDDGTVSQEFQNRNLHKLDAEWMESFGLFKNDHTLSFKLRGATIFGPPVEDFFNFYATGLPGMKGYPFYALGGGRVATANMTYRFPLLRNIDTRISPLYLDKLYLSLYGDFGNAWDGSDVKLSDFKKDIGAQLRLQAFSFYVFPTSIFFDAAYGLDEFKRTFQNKEVTYGKEWRFYFGMLFGFEL